MDNGRRVGGWHAKAAIRWRGEGRLATTRSLGRQHNLRSLMTFTGTVGRKRQQLAALETTVEETK
jgi:hypothetical protein